MTSCVCASPLKGFVPCMSDELRAKGVRSAGGKPLPFSDAYYTLNRIPKR